MAKATKKSKASACVPKAVWSADGQTMSISPELAEQIRAQQAEAARERKLINQALALEMGMVAPATTSDGPFVNSSAWIFAEAKRMKVAGEIPAGVSRTGFAKTLADRMKKAAKRDHSIRPIGWKSVSNRLASWGLWPTTSI